MSCPDSQCSSSIVSFSYQVYYILYEWLDTPSYEIMDMAYMSSSPRFPLTSNQWNRRTGGGECNEFRLPTNQTLFTNPFQGRFCCLHVGFCVFSPRIKLSPLPACSISLSNHRIYYLGVYLWPYILLNVFKGRFSTLLTKCGRRTACTGAGDVTGLCGQQEPVTSSVMVGARINFKYIRLLAVFIGR